jgi:hypothetical protein
LTLAVHAIAAAALSPLAPLFLFANTCSPSVHGSEYCYSPAPGFDFGEERLEILLHQAIQGRFLRLPPLLMDRV